MTGIRECFSDYQEEMMNFHITMGNKAKCTPVGKGTIVFQTNTRERFQATNVLHVPGLGMNLIFISQLQSKGYDVFFIKEKVYVKHPSWKNKVQIGIRSNRLYMLQLESPMALVDSNGNKDLNELWHRRMGNLHHKTVTGVPDPSTERDDVCRECALDNGGEYVDRDFIDFCAREGIRIEWTASYNPEQNGVAERKNKTIVEAAREMMYDQDMPKFLWAKECSTTVYVQNRTPHSALGKITLEHVFTGKTPEVSHFKIFGSLAYCCILEEKRKKSDQTAEKGYHVEYSENAKAYRIYLLGSRKVVVR
eukprot:PITA_03157